MDSAIGASYRGGRSKDVPSAFPQCEHVQTAAVLVDVGASIITSPGSFGI